MAITAPLDGLSAAARDRRRDELVAEAAAAPGSEAALAAIRHRLADYVPFDASCWFSVDPGTLFATWPVRIENIDSGHCSSYWEREFLVDDANLFVDLSRRPTPVATLLEATDGLLERSARYREFMRPQHFGDELRAALRSGPSTWGLLLLHRYEGERPFSPSDVQFLDELSRPLAEVMRSQVLQEMAMTAPASAGPGLMMFGADGHLESLNEAAQGWLAQLPYRTVDDIDTPVAVYTALAHARAVARGHQRGTARVRALSESGQWLVVHASSLVAVDGSAGPTAVVIEPASRVDLMPIIVDAYQLSAREQQVIGALARGSSTAEMAAELFLSPHTVRDHIKSIFAKVGVSSRSELVAQLFAEHYEPVVERRVAHA